MEDVIMCTLYVNCIKQYQETDCSSHKKQGSGDTLIILSELCQHLRKLYIDSLRGVPRATQTVYQFYQSSIKIKSCIHTTSFLSKQLLHVLIYHSTSLYNNVYIHWNTTNTRHMPS